jgi:hypothetical protein
VPSAGIRFAGEAAFLVLVALGLGLAQFSAIVIAVVMFVAWVLVAWLERASAKEAARAVRAGEEALPMPPPHVERIEVEPAQPRAVEESEPEPEAEPEPAPAPAVDERSARAILASAPPPLPPEPPKARAKPKQPRRRLIERAVAAPPPRPEPPPPPPPEPEPVVAGPPRAWNLWELQRKVRDSPEDKRHEEWSALLIYLREFANADGDLPLEFDSLVRESFAPLLAEEREPAPAS